MRTIAIIVGVSVAAALLSVVYLQHRSLTDMRGRLDLLEPGAVDEGFAQSMALHHQQAITMAQLMLDGRPTRLSLLARRIQGAQALELGEMRGWLQAWGKPLLPNSRSMGWMLLGDRSPDAALVQYLLDCEKSETGMPGLATNAELNRLRTSSGDERDRLFLQMMLDHHQGGIPMARFAADNAKIAVVRRLAARIVLDQSEEIASMRLLMQAADLRPVN
ncbi:DUF305 domain-containing protein [Sinimarinibacterium sp. CAU 1509]|uniref:DUF305 domain-containing protein n=1 Tax=Sinimarinibacterium sp. CAU 1509 TaxID=2562283 RepID=UPI00146E42E2|nr:DUF305 domain-containing protein [Sinimarinibacterium sp. CAU 1509]